MKQYFIKLFIKFFITKFRQHFIEYFVTTSSQQFWYRTSSQLHQTTSSQQFWYRTSSQLHFNKLFNNYSDRSSTNSSYHKLSQYHSRVRRLFITYFHNIFTTYFIDNKLSTNSFHKHQYSFMWQIIHHILSQHYHKLFIEYFNKFQHIFNTSSSCVNKFVNKFQQVSTRWMSIDFLLQLIQQTMVQFFNTILFAHSFQ